MSVSQANKTILTNMTDSVINWTEMFIEDTVNAAFDMRTTILTEDMMELRRVRWFSVGAPPELEKLWLRYVDRDIEEDEKKQSLHDFVMLGTSYILMQNPMTEEEYGAFIDHLANSVTWPHRATLVPQALREYFSDKETFKNVLLTNGWLVFLILLSTTNMK